MSKTNVLVFAEGHFEDFFSFATMAEAVGFSEGVTVGAGLYGAGACAAYILPEDDEEMREFEEIGEIEKALAKVAFVEGSS